MRRSTCPRFGPKASTNTLRTGFEEVFRHAKSPEIEPRQPFHGRNGRAIRFAVRYSDAVRCGVAHSRLFMSNDFFSGLLSSISERGRTLLRRTGPSDAKQDASDLIELCDELLSGAGEGPGRAHASTP